MLGGICFRPYTGYLKNAPNYRNEKFQENRAVENTAICQILGEETKHKGEFAVCWLDIANVNGIFYDKMLALKNNIEKYDDMYDKYTMICLVVV